MTVPGTLRHSGATIRVRATGTAVDDGTTVTATEMVRVGQEPSDLFVRVLAPPLVLLPQNPDGDPQARDADIEVVVTNTGSQPLSDVRIHPTSPTLVRSPGTDQDPLEPNGDAQRVIGDLAPGASASVLFPYIAVRPGEVRALVDVTAEDADGTLIEGGSATIRVGLASELQLDLGALPGTVTSGETVELELTVHNPLNAPGPVTGIAVAGPHVEEQTVEVVDAPSGDDVGFTLAPGASRTLRWRVRFPQAGPATVRFDASGRRDGEDVHGRGDAPLEGRDPAAVLGERMAALPAMYATLAQWIGGIGVAPENVYLVEYPDPSKDDQGSYCHYTFLGGPGELTPGEFSFLDDHMLRPLNAAGAAAAATHGWRRVGGIAAAFGPHGLCASQSWTVSIWDSLTGQGNQAGSFHPNGPGHRFIADRIYDAIVHGSGGGGGGAPGPRPAQVAGFSEPGADRLALRNDRFAVGDVVTVNPGAANQETRRIVARGSIVFDVPLRHAHGDGELIVRTAELPDTVGPPTANDDALVVAATGATELDVLANDTDPDTGDTLTVWSVTGSPRATVTGDGSAIRYDRGAPTDCEPDTFTYVAVDAGGATSEPATVTVTPACPTLGLAVEDVTVAEGGTATLAAEVTGAVGGATVSWDLDDDGVVDGTGTQLQVPAPDGPAQRSVAVTVVDGAGRTAATSATLTVVNVAPTGTLELPPSAIAGTAFTVGVTGIVDVPADLPVLMAFACGGGAFGAPSTATVTTCTPAGAGSYEVQARLDDGDGGVTTLSGTVTVTAAPPPPTARVLTVDTLVLTPAAGPNPPKLVLSGRLALPAGRSAVCREVHVSLSGTSMSETVPAGAARMVGGRCAYTPSRPAAGGFVTSLRWNPRTGAFELQGVGVPADVTGIGTSTTITVRFGEDTGRVVLALKRPGNGAVTLR